MHPLHVFSLVYLTVVGVSILSIAFLLIIGGVLEAFPMSTAPLAIWGGAGPIFAIIGAALAIAHFRRSETRWGFVVTAFAIASLFALRVLTIIAIIIYALSGGNPYTG